MSPQEGEPESSPDLFTGGGLESGLDVSASTNEDNADQSSDDLLKVLTQKNPVPLKNPVPIQDVSLIGIFLTILFCEINKKMHFSFCVLHDYFSFPG